MFKWLKILGITLGTAFCLLYFAFLISEANDPVMAIIFGMPFVAWPILTWKWTKTGALAMLVVAIVAAWFYLMNSLFADVSQGVMGFLLLGIVPAVVISGMLLYYWRLEGV